MFEIIFSAEINGSVSLKLDAQNGVDSDGVVDSSNVLCVFYKLPCLNPHIPCLLEGVIIPERVHSLDYPSLFVVF